MPENYQYALMLRALREVQAEIGQAPAREVTLFPGLADALDEIGRLPGNSILFGIAGDGLPLLLHLRNPRPGPILVTGDRGSGKTAFMKALVRAASLLTSPGTVHFAVLTDFPEEWEQFDAPDHLEGVWPAYERSASTLLFDLACRAQTRAESEPIVLLFDGLDAVLHMDDATQNNLNYLLAHGPASLIWPIVAVNAERAMKLPAWLSFFRTRIYGRITHPETGEELVPVPGAPLKGLFPGYQFCIREQARWLQFWLPGMPK